MVALFNKIKQKVRKNAFFDNVLKFDLSFVLMFVLSWILDEFLLCFTFCVFTVLHELSHFFVSKKLGYIPKKIHLTFFGASLEGVDDFDLKDEIKIVLAGPMVNLIFVVLCYLLFWFKPETSVFLNNVLIANWSIFLFNFLPIFPLDFGRILLAVFTKKYPRKEALSKVKKVSCFSLFILFCLFVLSFFFSYNFSLGFVCVNLTTLMFSATKDTSYKRQIFVEKKFKKLSKGLVERTVYVKNGEPLFALFKHIDDFHFVRFVFLNDKLEEEKCLTEIDFYRETGFL